MAKVRKTTISSVPGLQDAIDVVDSKYDASNPAGFVTQVQVQEMIDTALATPITGGTFDNPATGAGISGGAI